MSERNNFPDRGARGRFSDRSATAALVTVVPLAAAYFLAGKLGLHLAFLHRSATAFWPPSGIALAAILLLGRRAWPGIWIGAFLVNITTGGTVLTTIGIASGNTLEALLGAALVERFAGGRRAFRSARNVIRFIFLAPVLSTTVSATLGVASLALTGFAAWDRSGPIWLTWWIGDLVGALIVAPLIVIWATSPRPRWSPRAAGEALAVSVAVVVVGVLVFGRLLPPPFDAYPERILCVPVLLWAAYRFRQRGAITAAAVMSGIALWGTLLYSSSPRVQDMNDVLIHLQAFMGTVTATNLVLGAVLLERDRVDSALRASQRDLESRVEERTRDLALAHAEVSREIEEKKRLESRVAAAIESEQFRLGNALHDGIGQQLTGVAYLLKALEAELGATSPAHAAKARQARELIGQSVQEARLLAKGVFPMEVEMLGLGDALEELARRTSGMFGVECVASSRLEGAEGLPNNMAVRIFRIAREAVGNAARHSRAKRILVNLSLEDGAIVLSVEDDGVGLPKDVVKSPGLGIGIMQYRARAIGGTLDIRSGWESGTIVRCTIPLQAVAGEDAPPDPGTGPA